MVEARILKGFRDSLYQDEMLREELVNKIKKSFSLYGYAPIDTPCLEYKDILLSKSGGECEKQIYSFRDNGDREVALRFDLTIPFARFVAMHRDKEIDLPFKRYHIAKVWRGENTQAGRFREFYQCDIDSCGSVSAKSDAEILEVICQALSSLDVGDFEIHISHRAILKNLLIKLGIQDKEIEVLRILDKYSKIGEAEVKSLLQSVVNSEIALNTLLSFASVVTEPAMLENPSALSFAIPFLNTEDEGLIRLKEIYSLLSDNVKKRLVLDFSIARGLDYYTGFVFETYLTKAKNIGAIASGGRYDNLTGSFLKEPISGVGGSIGIDRLISALNVDIRKYRNADVYIVSDEDVQIDQKFLNDLRSKGIRVDESLDREKTNTQVYRYAEMNNIPYVVFYDPKQNDYTIKEILTHKEEKFNNLEFLKIRLLSHVLTK